MDAHSEARLADLHPVLAAKFHTMAEMLQQEGIELHIVQGFRTWAQQHALYLQGRAELTDVNACRLNCGLPAITLDQNHRVTDADAGESWHNYGLAGDCAPFSNGFPIWDEKHPAWTRIISVGESLGLRSGISWHDMPHFELTGKYGPKPPVNVLEMYQAANVHGSGSQAVWQSAEITQV